MENKHIELVKKWLADPKSVTVEELEANAESAFGFVGDAAWSAANAAAAARTAVYAANAATAAAARADVVGWVRRYEELTDE